MTRSGVERGFAAATKSVYRWANDAFQVRLFEHCDSFEYLGPLFSLRDSGMDTLPQRYEEIATRLRDDVDGLVSAVKVSSCVIPLYIVDCCRAFAFLRHEPPAIALGLDQSSVDSGSLSQLLSIQLPCCPWHTGDRGVLWAVDHLVHALNDLVTDIDRHLVVDNHHIQLIPF